MARHKIILILFFVLFLALGVSLFKDYGASWDEGWQRELGSLTFDYVVNGDQRILHYVDRAYGPFFEVVLVALEKGFHLNDNIRAIFLMRHLFTFLLFYLGVIFFYKLCARIFQSWRLGLLGCLFLVLSPRIFADAFYNSKDIPCLSVFIICAYTLINFLDHKTIKNALVHALACAALIDIRIVGILVPFLTFLFTLIDIGVMRFTGVDFKKAFLSLCAYCFFLELFTVLFWPFLWPSPLNNFIYALKLMSHFQWDGTVLYLGHYVRSFHLPWHYIPVWIAVTTPLTYVVTFCIGYARTIVLAVWKPASFYQHKRGELLALLLFSMPLLAVILFKSVLYDAWRQMFFIYPFFLILSLIGFRAVFNFVREKSSGVLIQTALGILIVFNLSTVVFFMVRCHPYQNIYFNSLAGRDLKEIKSKFELDYWGLSLTKVLEHIMANDNGRVVPIYADGPFKIVPTELLAAGDMNRLMFVENILGAKYFISDYRWHWQDYQYKNDPYYSVKVDGVPIAVAYRL